ncbi:unnamed protein product [Chironomus riparius]|uniref:Fatty acyl-CoA reductase n=1 Tax=Chironomus riparius TaxID=315576 RepID=A0A9N9RI11_9DIPT|nr:unnamed protein product [Chironomus riparius]
MTKLTKTQEFYKGKSIFITGSSGFMGKVLLEKLLYSCSDVKQIIILVRPKRGKSALQRVQDFSTLAMFKRINNEKPEVMQKIVPVFGDIQKENCGLNDEHLRKVIEESELVFHMAASLKLEATLKPNIEMNLLGTKHVIDMCKRMPKLMLLMHLSTAFCTSDKTGTLYERVYDWKDDPNDLIRCAEWMDEKTMENVQSKLLDPHPNTYTYTKRLAEILVRSNFRDIPACIVRPSIVTPAFNDPCPGWVDNLNGPVGIMVAGAKGVLRSMLCNGDFKGECIPVDFAINGIIGIAKSVATMKEKPSEIPVFNVTCHPESKQTWEYILEEGRKMVQKYPFEFGLWLPGGGITMNKKLHKLNVALFHWGPAYLIDFLMFCFGQKRFMYRVQQKISQGLDVLTFFTMREWLFDSKKFQQVFQEMEPDDKKIFYMDTRIITKDIELDYLRDTLLGGRQYCMKEPLSTLPKARIQLKIMKIIDALIKLFFLYHILRYILKATGLDSTISALIDDLNVNRSLTI